MSIDLCSFEEALPKKIIELAHEINAHGFKVGFVGGVVRDYIARKILSDDLDIELRLINDSDNLMNKYKELIVFLQQKFTLEKKKYNIISFSLSEKNIEITLPRKENFIHGDQTHSNFEAEFIKDSDYSQGFKRRDFTLNAIMIEFYKEFHLIDPLGGVSDLESGILIACSEDFSHDPVRLLRAVRFKVKYNLEFDSSLQKQLSHMPLSFNSFYLKTEMMKSRRVFSFLYELSLFEFDSLIHWKDVKEELIDYEKNIELSDLRGFIANCFYLPKKTRLTILQKLGLKSKGLLEFDLGTISKHDILLELTKHKDQIPENVVLYFTRENND